MTVATRNVSDMAHTGVPVVNPFAGGGRRQQTGKGGREKQGKEARPEIKRRTRRTKRAAGEREDGQH